MLRPVTATGRMLMPYVPVRSTATCIEVGPTVLTHDEFYSQLVAGTGRGPRPRRLRTARILVAGCGSRRAPQRSRSSGALSTLTPSRVCTTSATSTGSALTAFPRSSKQGRCAGSAGATDQPYVEVSVDRGGVTGDTLETLLNGRLSSSTASTSLPRAVRQKVLLGIGMRSRRSARRQWV